MRRYRLRTGRFIIAFVLFSAVAAALLWGTWSAVAWAKGTVVARFLDVRFLARDITSRTVDVEGIILRQEAPVKSPASGSLKLLVRDGERLRVGSPLAEINGISNSKIWSPRAGVFCTHLDGLENLLNPEMQDVLDMEAVETITDKEETVKEQVSAGELIGKVVDNLQPVIIYVNVKDVGNKSADFLKKGESVIIVHGEQELQGKLTQLWPQDQGVKVFVEVEGYPQSFVHQRRVPLQLVVERLEGWLVPLEAVVFKAGKPGLYVASKQKVTFMPVAVTGRLNGLVAVESDGLTETVRYISNPGLAREGMALAN